MREVRLTEPVRAFLKQLVPNDATIHGARIGAYELEISYRTAGGQHAVEEVATWRQTSVREV
jgi:hypothetical protein